MMFKKDHTVLVKMICLDHASLHTYLVNNVDDLTEVLRGGDEVQVMHMSSSTANRKSPIP